MHFTPALLAGLDAAGIAHATLTLHVGAGTFLPVKAEDTADHRMHAEWGRIDAATAGRLNAVRAAGGRVIAVGTTATRAVESVADPHGVVRPAQGWTEIVISSLRPIRTISGLITGWHDPDASHLLLVEAVAGSELTQRAYDAAAAERYRWHEFGDAGLFLP